jgi:hypothetical protein
MVKKRSILFLILLVFSGLAIINPASAQSNKISGYILDSNGHGLAGAQIIFNSLDATVGNSDNSGYYEVYAPAAAYHINVWPPFDSNYVFYDQSYFLVDGAITKNITLTSGYKVSGYISDYSGNPISGARFALDSFVAGWYSISSGYYFTTAPAGTYTLTAQPRTGPTFTSYSESNIVLNGNVVKNITVATPTSTPTPSPTLAPTPTPQPTQSPTQTPAPTTYVTPTPTKSPTPTSSLPSSQISITTDTEANTVGSKLDIAGVLSDKNGNALADRTVVLSYAVGSSSSWTQIGSGKTNSSGQYSIQWLIAASGTFSLKAEWSGDQQYTGSSKATTLSFLPYQDQKVFFVESNSTVTALSFNSSSLVFDFSVTGSSNTKGYVKITVDKTLVPNVNGITVYMDGNKLVSTVTSANGYWIIGFDYSHSTHQVAVNLNDQTVPEFPALLALALIFGLVTAAVVVTKRKHTFEKGGLLLT